jgi:hypothetical protein
MGRIQVEIHVSISYREVLLTLTLSQPLRAASTSLPSHQAIRHVSRTSRPTTLSRQVLHTGICSFSSFQDLTIGLSALPQSQPRDATGPRASAVTTSRTVYSSTLPPAPASLPPRPMFQNPSNQRPFPTLQFTPPHQNTMYQLPRPASPISSATPLDLVPVHGIRIPTIPTVCSTASTLLTKSTNLRIRHLRTPLNDER